MVLDIGCGAGAWMVRTALRFPRSEFVGIDPDLEALTRARGLIERNDLEERVSAQIADATHLDYEGTFDIAYLGEALSQMRSPDQVLRRVRRALKPGAHLVLLEGIRPARPGPEDAIVLAMNLDQILQGSRFFTRAELSGVLRQGGFRNTRGRNLGGGLGVFTATRVR
jgi:ubiquinone/menaquinone biosynthesis C-methylase UbiE